MPSTDLSINLNSPIETGAQQGDYCIEFPDQSFASDQAYDDKLSYTNDTQVFDEDYLITGAPVFKCQFKTSQLYPQLHVRLCDVSMENKSTLISYGVIELSHDEHHEQATALDPEYFYNTSIRLNEIAYTTHKGHKLRISVSTRSWTLFLSSPMPDVITVKACSLNIPRPSIPLQPLKHGFQEAMGIEPADNEILDYPKVKYSLLDQFEDHVFIQFKKVNYGESKIKAHGLVAGYKEYIKNTVCKSGTVSEYLKNTDAVIARTDHKACLTIYTGIIHYPDRVCIRSRIVAKLNSVNIYDKNWKNEVVLNATVEEAPADNIDSYDEIKRYMRYASRIFKEQKIKVKCIPRDEEIPIIAQFDRHAERGPIFTYMMGEKFSIWFPAFLAEFQYVEQWMQQFEPYMNLDNHLDLMLWVDGIKEMGKEDVHKAIVAYMVVNQDAASRMLNAIKNYQLPLNPAYIAKKANSLLYSYHYIERYRQWPSNDKLPSMIDEIMEAMPETIISNLEMVDESIMALYIKSFPPETKPGNNNSLSCTFF